jgi:hypothetical protein
MIEGNDNAVAVLAPRALSAVEPFVGAAGRAVLDLHSTPGTGAGDCDGCAGSHADGAVLWPCATVEAIAAAVGHPAPSGV